MRSLSSIKKYGKKINAIESKCKIQNVDNKIKMKQNMKRKI